MFFFRKKPKKKIDQETTEQSDIYVKDDHLLNIKLPDDFSSIILPQLIGYEQDENGNTINSSAIRQKQQHHHHLITREGWFPVTRFVGNESNRGTLVDTTNITAASLVQVNNNNGNKSDQSRQSTSLSSYGDTLTSHSKDDTENDSSDNEHHQLTCSSRVFGDEDKEISNCKRRWAPHLRIDRPRFKRRYPCHTVLLMHCSTQTTESNYTITASSTVNQVETEAQKSTAKRSPTISSTSPSSRSSPILSSPSLSSLPGSPSVTTTPPLPSSTPCSSSETMKKQTETNASTLPSVTCDKPLGISNNDTNTTTETLKKEQAKIPLMKKSDLQNNKLDDKKAKRRSIPVEKKRAATMTNTTVGKVATEHSSSKQRQTLKRHSLAATSTVKTNVSNAGNNLAEGEGTSIPRRPRSSSSCSSNIRAPKITATIPGVPTKEVTTKATATTAKIKTITSTKATTSVGSQQRRSKKEQQSGKQSIGGSSKIPTFRSSTAKA